jgi:hypothetical protein
LKRRVRRHISDELEALLFVVRYSRLEEYRVHTELSVQQGHIPIHFDKEVDALVPLLEVGVIHRQCFWATGASECPP